MIFLIMISLEQIVNWRTNLKFPDEAILSTEAKDLISKLLCNVECRLGTNGAQEIKVLPNYTYLVLHLVNYIAMNI